MPQQVNTERPAGTIPVLAVVGPTASGKTALGVRLAGRYGGEVVSADSMQIYTGMGVATAKPTAEEMGGVPHHLLDFQPPDSPFSVADYVEKAGGVIRDMAARGRQPVLVGGTGLYVSSLLDNIRFAEEKLEPSLRAALQAQAEERGGEYMLERLRAVDPEAAARLHPGDVRRILRALEVYEGTGRTMTEAQAASRGVPSPYTPYFIGIRYADRQALYDRINRRVDRMLEEGLLEEAEERFRSPLTGGLAQAIGHKELAPYFAGELSLEAAVENLKRETRRYAKRQLTWFGRDGRIRWLEGEGHTAAQLEQAAAEILDEMGFEPLGQKGGGV
ncbi:MAG: tRNA (adenosine(37)-N6)-dimethylallyltransferase MiaA [Clostridiales bacterium]|nr:tRNA (adenosine(37)-N6)-dimethylallyltransferase MiaA [Clostridiales bacterium]